MRGLSGVTVRKGNSIEEGGRGRVVRTRVMLREMMVDRRFCARATYVGALRSEEIDGVRVPE